MRCFSDDYILNVNVNVNVIITKFNYPHNAKLSYFIVYAL